jgi:hypothetical protein
MKIFLTEFIAPDNKLYNGPNIIAQDLRTAELAAFENGLMVSGELDSLYVTGEPVEQKTKTKYKDNIIPFPKNRTIH